MYKIHNVEQGSDEWFKSRLGLITASNFSKVLTPTGKPSSQVNGLINQAVAEILTGQSVDGFKSAAMERGNELESEAFEFLKFAHGLKFDRVGLLEAISKIGEPLGFACSPDGLNEQDGIGLELKCPLAHTQIAYLRAGVVPSEYILQIQGSMLVTGFKKWIFCSYHPLLPSLVIEVERDEKIIEDLSVGLKEATLEVSRSILKFGGNQEQNF